MDYEEWQKYIDYKKTQILEQIDNTNNLDNSQNNKSFIEILKSIINFKIFNVSKFTFLALKLLETSHFIDSNIIINIIKNTVLIQPIQPIPPILSIPPIQPIHQTNIINIIKIIIDLVVQVEISLNYHCILIIHFINKVKLKHKSIHLQPKIFNIFNKIDNDISQLIKPSTIILLFLKFVKKLGGIQVTNNTNNMLDNIVNFINNNSSIACTKFNIQKSSEINLKMKMYLDTFMININKYFINNSLDNHSLENNIYLICIEYIISIVELLYNNFNYLFNVLELCIIANYNYKKIDFTEDKKQDLEEIKNNIRILINDEINICKNLFKI